MTTLYICYKANVSSTCWTCSQSIPHSKDDTNCTKWGECYVDDDENGFPILIKILESCGM